MTAYNRERYIGAAIESVLGQSYPNFELVIVDDASSDATVVTARAYAAGDARVRIVVNERNLGDYPNRNHAFSYVTTPLFKYHDSDDVMYPHCLETMVAAIEAHRDADFALTTSRPWAGGPCPMLLTPWMCYAREYFGEGMFHLGPACALFRREAFERFGPFRYEGTISDYFFWMRTCRTATVVLVAGDLFWYRRHEGQELQSSAAHDSLLRVERAAWEALFDPACPLTGSDLQQARRNRLTGLVRRSASDVLHGDWRMGLRRLRAPRVRARDWVRYFGGRRLDLQAGTPSLGDA
jgi:glycosyltransferase involved in cell wall biosynthesis